MALDYPDGARQLQCGAPRRYAPMPPACVTVLRGGDAVGCGLTSSSSESIVTAGRAPPLEKVLTVAAPLKRACAK